MTNPVADSLKSLLGSTFVLYMKTQQFHWNVEGMNFPQLHELFGEIYSDVYGSIDPMAEHIRAQDEYAPCCLARMLELSSLKEQPKIPKAELMLKELLQDLTDYIHELDKVFAVATEAHKDGIANFIADRQIMIAKWMWQVRATLA